MKENFMKSLELILKYEGGFSGHNHDHDRGGPTNLGITLRTLQNFYNQYGYGDFDRDGDIDVDDIRLLDTIEKAAPVYKTYFWDAMKLDNYPSRVDFILFDFAVNSGPKNAVKLLQRALNKLQEYSLIIDGIAGPKVRSAMNKVDIELLICALLNERDIFYRKIVAMDHSQEVFLRGWLNRVAN